MKRRLFLGKFGPVFYFTQSLTQCHTDWAKNCGNKKLISSNVTKKWDTTNLTPKRFVLKTQVIQGKYLTSSLLAVLNLFPIIRWQVKANHPSITQNIVLGMCKWASVTATSFEYFLSSTLVIISPFQSDELTMKLHVLFICWHQCQTVLPN